MIACLVLTPYVLYQQILNAKEYGFLFTQSYWMTCHVLRLLFFIQPCHDGHKQVTLSVGQKVCKISVLFQALRLKRTTVKLAATDWPRDVHKQVFQPHEPEKSFQANCFRLNFCCGRWQRIKSSLMLQD